MIKILFLIHDLGQGGAERVLVNLVNNMDKCKFDITVMTLFDCGDNRELLDSDVRYRYWKKKAIRGNSHLMKLFSPEKLHEMIIREQFDIEVAFLEGPSARVISGCADKKSKQIVWIHSKQDKRSIKQPFRNLKEVNTYYRQFDKIICVSDETACAFKKCFNEDIQTETFYNPNDIPLIRELSQESAEDIFSNDRIILLGVGKLVNSKGFDTLIRITASLIENGYPVQLILLGEGPRRKALMKMAEEYGITDNLTLAGYKRNPYPIIKNADVFLCASRGEGFSTAAVESMVLETAVCTMNVGGMKEMLGENDEYGIVTDNNEQALYEGVLRLLDNPSLLDYYKTQAKFRAETYGIETTVNEIEKMLEDCANGKK